MPPFVDGERLSDVLVRNGALKLTPSLDIQWRIPEAALSQAQLKHRLLVALSASPELPGDSRVRARLASWLAAMPVTGRVVLPTLDARHMQGQPEEDPILRHGQSVLLGVAPANVSVITDTGQPCSVAHSPGAEADHYLRACSASSLNEADTAWVIQPDGTVGRFGVASWNMTAQDEPAPGALIWAPDEGSAWPKWFSDALARFLATQSAGTLVSDRSVVRMEPYASASQALPASFMHGRDLATTTNDWGSIGLLQIPTARMAAGGEVRASLVGVYPYARFNLMFQPLDWLEAGFRYTSVLNRFYGDATFSGDQNYLDKSLDFKLRLARETRHTPELALGMVDIGGTGLFSSEYIVASKRTGDLDWSLGMAWGYLGNRGSLKNPLSVISSGMNTRPVGAGGAFGGTVGTGAWFRGPVSLFGGVQWQTPWPNLIAKAEYEGNNYQTEPQGNNQRQRTPINLGVVYRHADAFDFSLGIERGDTLMLGVSIRGGLDKLRMPKFIDPEPIPVRAARPSNDPDWKLTSRDIERQTAWTVSELRKTENAVVVVIDGATGAFWNERIERAAAVLHRDAPAAMSRFVFRFRDRGVSISERVVMRDAWARRYLEFSPFVRESDRVGVLAPEGTAQGERVWAKDDGRISGGIGPNFQQTVGGPDGYVLFQAGISADAEVKLSPHTWINARATLRMLDNYTSLVYNGSPSSLPPVRTLLRSYLTSSRFNLPQLQLTHFDQLSRNQYFSLYGGYLEYGYAGVGAEWLYRPWHAQLAVGVDVNHVKQRGFKQDFELRDYSVNTGHLSLYWDTGWRDTRVKLMAGQYLAADRGITVDVSRTFDNGVTLGGYATKTNVSAAQFGEGSFDKGIYLSIPFDSFLPFRSGSTANFFWAPLTRDGGARLSRRNSLYRLTDGADRRTARLTPYAEGEPRADEVVDGKSEWSFIDEIWHDAGGLGRRLASSDFQRPAAIGAGIVLAASLFDRSGARWADSHQGGNWDRAGKAANAIPLVAAAGVGMVWSGLLGDDAARTARISAKAMVLTVAVETAMKYAIGRSRPDAGVGATNFDVFGAKAGNSAFPSIHAGVAFAALTPFVRRYEAPWLYGIAALTGFGRIQSRQHFMSDIVAGGLIGYGLASALHDEDQHAKSGPTLIIDPRGGVRANWMFD